MASSGLGLRITSYAPALAFATRPLQSPVAVSSSPISPIAVICAPLLQRLNIAVVPARHLSPVEAEAYALSGGEAQFNALNEQLDRIINTEMPGYFGPYTG